MKKNGAFYRYGGPTQEQLNVAFFGTIANLEAYLGPCQNLWWSIFRNMNNYF